MAILDYAAGITHLPDWGEAQLVAMLDELGVPVLHINSTFRTPAEQASAMFENIKSGNLIAYGRAGSAVQQTGKDMLAQGWPEATVVAAMTKQIEDLGPEHVSLHCSPDWGNEMCVFDGSAVTLNANYPQFVQPFISYFSAKHSAGLIGEWLYPKWLGAPAGQRDPAFHIQLLRDSSGIAQVEQAAKNEADDVMGATQEIVLGDGSSSTVTTLLAIGAAAFIAWWLFD
jgi:hypothetical protein